MIIDYTITVGNIVEIGSIIIGGLLVLFTLKTDVNVLKIDIANMQSEIKKLGDILVNLADIRGEIRVHDTRITAIEQDVREIRNTLGK